MIEANQAEERQLASCPSCLSLGSGQCDAKCHPHENLGIDRALSERQPAGDGEHSVIDAEVHQNILEGIANHDPDAAVAAMNRHIRDMLTAVG